MRAVKVEADFRPLISVLQAIQQVDCSSFEEQQAVFERQLVSYELDPDCYNWEQLRYALGTAVALAEAMQGRDWTPGREDLTPLFEIEELAAS